MKTIRGKLVREPIGKGSTRKPKMGTALRESGEETPYVDGLLRVKNAAQMLFKRLIPKCLSKGANLRVQSMYNIMLV